MDRGPQISAIGPIHFTSCGRPTNGKAILRFLLSLGTCDLRIRPQREILKRDLRCPAPRSRPDPESFATRPRRGVRPITDLP